jgi:uncharacterized membrane protein
VDTQARIAVYDDLLASPRIVDIEPAPILDFIENITTATYDLSHAQGGSLPYTVIREIAENFIHANFKECTVSILEGGNTLRFSDQGPGIEKKSLVLQPGVTSATAAMKRFIKGVGSGFPVVREYLGHSHGFMSIDDNAAAGTVITLVANHNNLLAHPAAGAQFTQTANQTPVENSVYLSSMPAAPTAGFATQATAQQATQQAAAANLTEPTAEAAAASSTPALQIKLLPREEQTLLLLLEKGLLGPSELAGPLGISKPTATRVLQKLESLQMVETAQFKKRILSNTGLAYAQQLLNPEPTP